MYVFTIRRTPFCYVCKYTSNDNTYRGRVHLVLLAGAEIGGRENLGILYVQIFKYA